MMQCCQKINGLNRLGLFIAVICLLTATACADSGAESGHAPPAEPSNSVGSPVSPSPAPPPLEQCRSDLEDQMTTLLANLDTDVDFSLYLETETGRAFTFNRGESTLLTAYKSASTSKWISTVIILRLVDQGVLTLQDHPQDYIASWPIEPPDPLFDLTLSQLLSFTSGLKLVPQCLSDPLSNMRTCSRHIALRNMGKGHQPGTDFDYGFTHLQIAGLMAVNAAGVQSWQDLFERFRQETGLFPNGRYDIPSTNNPRLGGGMRWNGQEYSDFIRAFFFGDLLSETLKTEMLQDQIDGAAIGYSPILEELNEDWHYGFGIWLECPAAPFNCQTITSYSSPGVFGAYPFINTQHRFFGIVARDGGEDTLAQGKAIYEAISSYAEKWTTSPENCRQ